MSHMKENKRNQAYLHTLSGVTLALLMGGWAIVLAYQGNATAAVVYAFIAGFFVCDVTNDSKIRKLEESQQGIIEFMEKFNQDIEEEMLASAESVEDIIQKDFHQSSVQHQDDLFLKYLAEENRAKEELRKLEEDEHKDNPLSSEARKSNKSKVGSDVSIGFMDWVGSKKDDNDA